MAPEQIRGTKLDSRADIYACGILLFELLTGKKPFNSVKDDPIEVCSMHLKVPVPRMEDVLPGQDFGELEEVVAKALAKSADDRYGSAVEFAAALDAVMPRRRLATPATGMPTVGSGPSILVTPPVDGGRGRTTSPPAADAERAGGPRPAPVTGTPAAGAPVARMPTPHAGTRFASQPTQSRAPTMPAPSVASPSGLAADFDLSLAIPQAPPSTQPIAEDDVIESAGVPQIDVRRPPPTAMFAGAPPAGPSPLASANGAPLAPETAVESQPIVPPARFTGRQIATALLVIAVGVGVIVLAVKLGGGGEPAPADALAAVAPPKEDPVATILARATELAAARKGDEAIDLLTASRRPYPNDARLAYQAGKLYFAKLWYSDGLHQFHDAIRLDAQYRSDPELLRMVLKGFITTPRLNEDLANFLHDEIGTAAKPALLETSTDHPNPMIRARAAAELRRYR